MALRVPSAAEGGLWALIRDGVAAGGWRRRIAEAAIDALRPQKAAPALPGQRALWVVDAEGLPPRPWRVAPEDVFDCLTLGCRNVRVAQCVARQKANDIQRTEQPSRGQSSDFPGCDTRRCAQGRGIREALDSISSLNGERGPTRGSRGFGLRRRDRTDTRAQGLARERQERAGLLDVPRILDQDPDPTEEA